MSNIRKVAMFTDIHFGKKNNSTQHNQDCLDYVTWFCNEVKKDNQISHVVFMGDWFENRNSVNVMTMDYAGEAVKLLAALNLPIYIIIGNHDLYHRESRKVFSTKIFKEFTNITLVSEPLLIEDKILVCPFLFKNEYSKLVEYANIPYWMGHFEFRNFVVTGSDRRLEHGPDHKQFNKPKHIFSGHYHKRQATDNVIYIGNTFPMDYGDAWDDTRGMCVLNAVTGDVDFTDWLDCPKYRKVRLSDVLNDPTLIFPKKCRVRCTVDINIAYTEAQALREEMIKQLELREFSLEENIQERKDAIAGDDQLGEFDLSLLNEAVIKMIQTGITKSATINPERLVGIYETL